MLSRTLKFGLFSLQWVFLTAGAVLLGSQAWHQVHAEQIRAEAIESIVRVDPVADNMPDTIDWSPGRIAKWEAGQKDSARKARAVLVAMVVEEPAAEPVAALQHTASNRPLMVALGTLMLALGGGIGFMRRFAS